MSAGRVRVEHHLATIDIIDAFGTAGSGGELILGSPVRSGTVADGTHINIVLGLLVKIAEDHLGGVHSDQLTTACGDIHTIAHLIAVGRAGPTNLGTIGGHVAGGHVGRHGAGARRQDDSVAPVAVVIRSADGTHLHLVVGLRVEAGEGQRSGAIDGEGAVIGVVVDIYLEDILTLLADGPAHGAAVERHTGDGQVGGSVARMLIGGDGLKRPLAHVARLAQRTHADRVGSTGGQTREGVAGATLRRTGHVVVPGLGDSHLHNVGSGELHSDSGLGSSHTVDDRSLAADGSASTSNGDVIYSYTIAVIISHFKGYLVGRRHVGQHQRILRPRRYGAGIDCQLVPRIGHRSAVIDTELVYITSPRTLHMPESQRGVAARQGQDRRDDFSDIACSGVGNLEIGCATVRAGSGRVITSAD